MNYFQDHFVYKQVELYDNIDENISIHLEDCIEFIAEAKRNQKKVLVHCI